MIDKVLAVRGQLGLMRAAFRQALKRAAIKLYAAKMPLSIVAGVGGHEKRIPHLTFNIKYFEISLGNLVDELGIACQRISFVKRIEIKMRVAVAPAWPGKLVSGLKELEIVVSFNPRIARLTEHPSRLATGGVNKIEIQLVLRAIEHRGPDHVIVYPAKARHVDVFVISQVKPLHGSAAGAHHSELNGRIGIAHLGIFFLV